MLQLQSHREAYSYSFYFDNQSIHSQNIKKKLLIFMLKELCGHLSFEFLVHCAPANTFYLQRRAENGWWSCTLQYSSNEA